MIYKLKMPQERSLLEQVKIFSDWNETLIFSALSGIMGEVFVTEKVSPRSAAVLIGDFCFFSGQCNSEFIRFICAGHGFLILIPENEKWSQAISETLGKNCRKVTRFATKMDTAFNTALLSTYAGTVPNGFEVRPIDEKLYNISLAEEWSRDFVSLFGCYDRYRELGLGFVALKGGFLAAGASSYSRYPGGIEIEVDTKKEFRRIGLAKACAARLILECLSRGLYPSWDAQNKTSLHLAENLGYTLSYEYDAYEIIK